MPPSRRSGRRSPDCRSLDGIASLPESGFVRPSAFTRHRTPIWALQSRGIVIDPALSQQSLNRWTRIKLDWLGRLSPGHPEPHEVEAIRGNVVAAEGGTTIRGNIAPSPAAQHPSGGSLRRIPGELPPIPIRTPLLHIAEYVLHAEFVRPRGRSR